MCVCMYVYMGYQPSFETHARREKIASPNKEGHLRPMVSGSRPQLSNSQNSRLYSFP